MRQMKVLATLGAGVAVTIVAVLAAGSSVRGADHGDAPLARADTRIDINDVYIFESPERPANTVLIMTVCPLAGVTGPTQFAPKVRYEFAIDTNGDAVENQVYSVMFGAPNSAGAQKFALRAPGKKTFKGTTGGFFDIPAELRYFAGLVDDPFFFDLIAFKHGLAFSEATAHNFFNGLNTLAIVIEVPTASFGELTASTMGVWARTLKGRKQIDRMGRPAINTALINGPDKDAFNANSPKDDRTLWRTKVVAKLMAAPFSRNATDAGGLADALLPDILTYSPASAAGFLNGRKLTDDVIDAELNLLSGGAVTTDFVNSDNTFRATFPYLGVPNP